MSYPVFEYTLSKLLTDELYLREFEKNPELTLKNLDLIMDERLALLKMDFDQLSMAAHSFRKKRSEQTKEKILKHLWSQFKKYI